MTYTIRNTYHNTIRKTNYSPEDRERIAHSGNATPAEKRAMRRSKTALCGMSGCTCSNDWGERN